MYIDCRRKGDEPLLAQKCRQHRSPTENRIHAQQHPAFIQFNSIILLFKKALIEMLIEKYILPDSKVASF